MIARLSLFAFLLMLTGGRAMGQDFIRLGVAHDFRQSRLVNTFSFDFNRTEKVDEKKGRYLFFGRNNVYILPSTDVNLGEGTTSSENNVLVQINAGKAWYGKKSKSRDTLTTYVLNRALELNPSYNADKFFNEKLYYGQGKYLFNFVAQQFLDATDSTYIRRVRSVSLGPFATLGHRTSKTFDVGSLYSTAGVLLEYKTRLLNKKQGDDLILKLTGSYYRILSDVEQLTTDNYAGLVKSSIDAHIISTLFLGLTHKYGNDNPSYKYVHTLELSAKIKY